MKQSLFKIATILAILLLPMESSAKGLMGKAAQLNNANEASARIRLCVVIPEVLLFRINDGTSGANNLEFPTSVTVPTASGSLDAAGNSGATSIFTGRETTDEITYTAASL